MSENTSDKVPAPQTSRQTNDETVVLPGWPGYRTRPGRSGFDYIDTQIEMSHMAGVFLRQFFSGMWLRSGNGPHPMITLIVGVALILCVPGSEIICLGMPVVLMIGLLAAMWNGMVLLSGKEDEEIQDLAEEVPEINEAEEYIRPLA